MSIVGAYIDLGRDSDFHWGSDTPYMEADYLGRSPEGLEVAWKGAPPPDQAQVYLYWVPKVVAVWDEEEIENGEVREDADGSDVEQRDEEVPAESDLGTGEGGAEPGDSRGFGDDGGYEEVEGTSDLDICGSPVWGGSVDQEEPAGVI